MSEVMDAYWRTPPIARNIATAIFVTSLGAHLGLIPFRWLIFHPALLFRMPPQVWRLATTFLVSGPKLSIILDPYYVYSYLSQLEIGSPRFSRREDLVWYLMFVGTVIMALGYGISYTSLVYVNTYICLPGLILSIAYTSTQDQRGQKASFFFFTIPAQLIPYSMMAITCILDGPQAVLLQICGLLAAHLYDFLSRLYPEFGGGPNLLPTPAFVSRLTGAATRVQQRSYGTAIRGTGMGAGVAAGSSGSAAAGAGAGSSTASSQGGGPLPDAWKTRGRGHRLGGD